MLPAFISLICCLLVRKMVVSRRVAAAPFPALAMLTTATVWVGLLQSCVVSVVTVCCGLFVSSMVYLVGRLGILRA